MHDIKIEKVSFSYCAESKALDNISISIPQGSFCGIIGPNGAGKSTLLKILAGFLSPDSGDIFVGTKALKEIGSSALAKTVSYLPVAASEYFSFSVFDLVMLGRHPHIGLMNTPSLIDRQVVDDCLKLTDIIHLRNKSINEISSGEKQRALIAQSLVQEPAILLLDEPASHMDIAHQKAILDLIKSFCLKRNITAISVFHDLNAASEYSDLLFLFNKGALVYYGSPSEVLKEDIVQGTYGIKTLLSTNPLTGKPHVFF